ncbi:family 78 glycoside hydrolase catalytic domain [Chitinophaga pinensis]|nr:family 78 glycoside hydrolase catalytic domain [Chitinophaga pinensis]
METWQPRFTYYGFRYVQVEGAAPDTALNTGDVPQIISLDLLHTRMRLR